jgi:hypothetical protein
MLGFIEVAHLSTAHSKFIFQRSWEITSGALMTVATRFPRDAPNRRFRHAAPTPPLSQHEQVSRIFLEYVEGQALRVADGTKDFFGVPRAPAEHHAGFVRQALDRFLERLPEPGRA